MQVHAEGRGRQAVCECVGACRDKGLWCVSAGEFRVQKTAQACVSMCLQRAERESSHVCRCIQGTERGSLHVSTCSSRAHRELQSGSMHVCACACSRHMGQRALSADVCRDHSGTV